MTNHGEDVTNRDLERFVAAQAETYARALAEIRKGRKTSHWMWFVFPQLEGLGRSEMARFYALRSLEEARRYLRHPILGSRYLETVTALQALHESSAEQVFGAIDALKLRSSLTLFSEAAPEEPLFRAALDRWFGAAADPQTLALLRRS